jgi:large subunit ribosomal protein L35
LQGVAWKLLSAPVKRSKDAAILLEKRASTPESTVNAAGEALVARKPRLCHNAALTARPVRAAVAVEPAQFRADAPSLSLRAHPGRAGLRCACADEESKMPKLKTKSGAKKRFKITASGKVKYQQAGKRHGMIKRTTKQIRNKRGTNVLFKSDGDNIKKYWLPNG